MRSKTVGIDPKTRPTCGQDAEVAAIQRICKGYEAVCQAANIK